MGAAVKEREGMEGTLQMLERRQEALLGTKEKMEEELDELEEEVVPEREIDVKTASHDIGEEAESSKIIKLFRSRRATRPLPLSRRSRKSGK